MYVTGFVPTIMLIHVHGLRVKVTDEMRKYFVHDVSIIMPELCVYANIC